ncbi:hypothetical protein [Weissella kandleri]|nr:hypothetical protein [Weissella kandleri]
MKKIDYNVIETVQKFVISTLEDEQTKYNPGMVESIAKILGVIEEYDQHIIDAVKGFVVETLGDKTKNNSEMVAAIAKLLDVTTD